jgi:hypothetical protein
MSDLVERVAMKIAEAEIEYFGPKSSLVQCQSWALCPDCYRNAARAVIALARKETLEEAAKLVEERTLRNRTIYALQNGICDYVRPCEHAAAIRKLGEE